MFTDMVLVCLLLFAWTLPIAGFILCRWGFEDADGGGMDGKPY